MFSFFDPIFGPLVPQPVQILDWPEIATISPGTSGKDVFVAQKSTSGNIFQDLADTIDGFDASKDKIWIPEGLTYAGNTLTPGSGEYSVWMKDGNHIITWINETGGWNDVIVKGDNPLNNIEAVIPDNTIINTHISGLGPTTMYGTTAADVFEFNNNTTGDVYKDQADAVKGFNEDHDFILLPDGLVFGGTTNSPGQGEFSVWQQDDKYVVTWYENGYHDVLVEGDNPLGGHPFGWRLADRLAKECGALDIAGAPSLNDL